jgi:hypothetical protein
MSDLPYVPFERAEQATTDKIRRLFDYWIRLNRDGKPGLRTAFDATEVPNLLSSLLLGDIESDPFRVFFRLVGTRVANFSRLDFSGRYLDALDYRGRDSVEWIDCYRQVHATGVGVVGTNRVTWPDDAALEYAFAILPLEGAGHPAGSFVGIEDYDRIDALLISDMPEVRVFPKG